MPLKVTFELDDKDLRYFRSNMKKARDVVAKTSEAEVVEKAHGLIAEVSAAKVPAFVRQRTDQLAQLIAMLGDKEWNLAVQERKNVIAALAYFTDPHDIIPDSVPVLGYIDDAIMIELVVTELKHEIDAYADFVKYRREEKARSRNSDLSRAEYLEIKRRALHDRLRRRRRSVASRSGSGSRPRFRLF